jgi:hypothetical protein
VAATPALRGTTLALGGPIHLALDELMQNNNHTTTADIIGSDKLAATRPAGPRFLLVNGFVIYCYSCTAVRARHHADGGFDIGWLTTHVPLMAILFGGQPNRLDVRADGCASVHDCPDRAEPPGRAQEVLRQFAAGGREPATLPGSIATRNTALRNPT